MYTDTHSHTDTAHLSRYDRPPVVDKYRHCVPRLDQNRHIVLHSHTTLCHASERTDNTPQLHTQNFLHMFEYACLCNVYTMYVHAVRTNTCAFANMVYSIDGDSTSYLLPDCCQCIIFSTKRWYCHLPSQIK